MIAVLLACVLVVAQSREILAAMNEERLALVVGAAGHRNGPPLKNPVTVNTDRDMAKALQTLGFAVIRTRYERRSM